MTIAKQRLFSIPSPSAVFESLRAYFSAPVDYDPAPQEKPQSAACKTDPVVIDKSRYARLLEHELDRQLLTDVEREDTEMLNRVRSALYEA